MPTVSPPYAPGFKETAAYFDKRAKRTRNLERSLEFSETADFYNGLAAIVPSFPPRYKIPAMNGNKWSDRAEECRAMAEALNDEDCRRRLTDLAQHYERMARRSS